MPESKGRKPAPKKTPAQKRAARAATRKSPVPPNDPAFQVPVWTPRKNAGAQEQPSRNPIRELSGDAKFEMPDLPEPATYAQVLVALSRLDPLEQTVMIAQRIAAMPSQKDGGMPVNIHRHVRAPWADQLRKLGIFVIPELATHELVADPGAGIMENHTAGRLQKITTDDFWEMAQQQDPALAKIVEDADTPEKKRKAMRKLAGSLPVEVRVAMERLMSHDPEDLAPR